MGAARDPPAPRHRRRHARPGGCGPRGLRAGDRGPGGGERLHLGPRAQRGRASELAPGHRSAHPPAALVPHDRRDPARVGRERPLVQRAERAAVPAPSAEPEGTHRLAHARPVPGRLPRDRAALGRRLRGVGRAAGAAAQDRGRGRPDGRPDGLHAAPVPARPGIPARGAPGDPAHRPHHPRPPVREPLRGQRRARHRPAPRAGPANGLRPPAGAPVPRGDGVRPARPVRPAHLQPARGAAVARLVALLGGPLLPHEGGAGAPHPQARPGRRREPQRLRLHRRVHPLGLHPPVAVRRRGGGRPVRELPGARSRRPRALQPGLRGEAALRSHGKAHADRDPGVRLLPLPADPRRPVDLDGPGTAGRGHRHQLLRLGQPALHQPAPLRRDAGHRPHDARRAAAGAALRPRAARGLRHGERGAGPAGPARGGALPHVRRRALHHLCAAGGAGRGSLQLRRRHAPRGRARAAGPRPHAVAPARGHPRRRVRPGRRRLGARRGDADRHRPGRLRAHALGGVPRAGARRADRGAAGPAPHGHGAPGRSRGARRRHPRRPAHGAAGDLRARGASPPSRRARAWWRASSTARRRPS